MDGIDLIVTPDDDDPDASLVFVDGAVDGRPYRFLLDTGSARTCVQIDEYTSGFVPVGTSRSSGLFAAGPHHDLITVPRLELGPIAKTDVAVARVSPHGPHTGNLIGMDVLKDHRCHVRLAELRLLVDPPADPLAGSIQPLVLDPTNHPYVDVRFGDAVAQAAWDTGAGITVVDLGFVRRHTHFFRQVGQSRGTDSTGATMPSPTFVMAATVIGGLPFPPHTVAGVDLSRVNATIDLSMDMVLGYSTLSRADWWFDFPGRRWAVTKLTTP
ncbi:MAG TPA: retropepsin-like aspartic protease [Thermomicrobiales bacterium]|jgi:hypothetical protein